MLDVAIQKVEKQLLQTDKSFITDKKMLLLSMKQIMLDFCRNINVNDAKKRPISLRIVFCYNIKCKRYILNVLDLAIKFLKWLCKKFDAQGHKENRTRHDKKAN